MDCKIENRTKIVNDYITGELDEKQAAEFELHYFSCDVCYRAVKLSEKMIVLIKDENESLFAKYLKKKHAPVSNSVFQRLEILLPRLFKNQPIPIFAALAFIILLFGSYFTYEKLHRENNFAHIVYDDKVPYEFVPAADALRSVSESRAAVSDIDTFYGLFLEAMLEYKDLNYSRTLEILKPLNAGAQEIQKKSNKKAVLSLIRDYYFYSGISHFALARSQRAALAPTKKQYHQEEAVKLLTVSEKIAIANQLDFQDRDTFFLGLAYGFAGQLEEAVSGLRKIPVSSRFFKESGQFIKKWSE